MADPKHNEVPPGSRVVALDALDRLNAEASHLCAMLALIYGNGFESFSRFSDDIQQDYLWACAQRARELRSIAAGL